MAADPACVAAAKAAANGKLTDDEIARAFKLIEDQRTRLSGQPDQAAKLRRNVATAAERGRIAAAMQRRHASLNILARDRINAQMGAFRSAGLTPKQSLLAILEGSQKGVEGARDSVGALNGAYEARYIGGMMAEIQANRPHLVHAMRDQAMDADIMREMAEIKEGGRPGITGNADARYVAKVFSDFAELARTDLNRLGAAIGKLDGWAGAQVHDDIKMIAAGKESWISAILPRLDVERSFPDVETAADLREILGDMYDTITTGLPNKVTPREKGQRVNPANMAKSLGKSRVLHFKDADASMAYRAEFGYGNTVSGIVSHLRNSARLGAVMEKLGPNPEVMFGSLVDAERRRIRDDPDMTPEQKAKALKGVGFDGGAIRQAFDVASGLVSKPVSTNGAKIGADIRAVQSMAKLGGAVITSISDTVTTGLASQFRGSGFLNGFIAQIDGAIRGRPSGERAEISYLVGEGFDGILGHIVSPAAAVDGPVGRLAKLQEHFFRWNGLTWWTDVQRATAGRMISAEMGMRAAIAFDALPDNYRHVLGLHNIDGAKWEAIRTGGGRDIDGRTYVTPDAIRDIPDDAIEPIVQDRIDAARDASRIDEAKTDATRAKREAEFEARKARIIDDGRRKLELDVLGFFADETSYGVIETDARSRRTTTLGLRPGTFAGESIRFVMQFKGFPLAFTQRVGGRALFGHRGNAGYLERAAHIGTLVAGMTMAGYASLTMKDLLRGYWPPRDPTDPRTWAAAFVQGGAAGIYGDFLFGSVNRFGSGPLATAIGPTIGNVGDLADLSLKLRDFVVQEAIGEDAKAPKAELLNAVLNNTPFINLAYARPVLDYLFLNSMREAISPGYTRRQEKRRQTDMGQHTIPALGDRQFITPQ